MHGHLRDQGATRGWTAEAAGESEYHKRPVCGRGALELYILEGISGFGGARMASGVGTDLSIWVVPACSEPADRLQRRDTNTQDDQLQCEVLVLRNYVM
jgi:hypothetical protein